MHTYFMDTEIILITNIALLNIAVWLLASAAYRAHRKLAELERSLRDTRGSVVDLGLDVEEVEDVARMALSNTHIVMGR